MVKKKYTGNGTEILQVCNEYDEAFNEIQQYVFKYARTQKSIKKVIGTGVFYAKTFKEHSSFIFDEILEDLTVLSVLSSPYHIGSCLKYYRSTLSDSSLKILKYWKNVPFFFSVFRIEEMFDDDFYSIVDVYTGVTSLLHCPTLLEGREELPLSNVLFYTSLFDNGSCVQSVGYVYTTFLRKNDFMFLLSYFSPIPLTSITQHIVTKIVVENYFPFSLIFLIHPDPYDKVGSYEKSYSFSVHTMKPDCASLLQSNEYITMINSTEQVDVYLITERTQALKDQFFALFSHRESYFSDILDEKFRISLISRLYHHKKDNRVYIESFSVEGYSLMKLFLESFPEFAFSSPSRTPTLASTRYSNCNSIHIALFALMLDLFPKKNLPWTMFLDPFQKQHEQAYVEEDDEEDLDEDELEEEGFIEELDSFDDQMYEALLLFSDLLKRSRSRKKRKKKRINTSQLELFALNDKDSLFIHQFPLEKVGIIDPSLVERLALSFYEGEVIFCVTKDDDEFGLVAREALESLGNNDFKTRVEQTDFPEAIEDMISCFDDEVAYAILNTILYSLHYYYDEWVSAHALCVTVFRNYNELLMSRYDSREVVLSEISRFIYSQLCASGILQVNERVKRENRESGNYALKPTELFNALFLFNTNLRSR